MTLRPDRGPSIEGQTGERVHRLLGLYARRGERPSPEEIYRDARNLLRSLPFSGGFNPGPQRVAALTAIGLRHFPPLTWSFIGAEVPTGNGRVDLAWRTPGGEARAGGSIVFDEFKAGFLPGQLDGPSTLDQVERYLAFGTRTFGAMFVGVRLVALSRPRKSRLYRPGPDWRDAAVPLQDTPLWFVPQLGSC